MRLLSGLTLGCLVAISPVTRADDSAKKPITVPFKMLVTRHMTVQIKVNGKGPYRVIFDTGAPITLLSNKIAQEAGLGDGGSKSLFSLESLLGSLVGGVEPTKAKTLRIGDLEAKDVSVIVMDHPTVGMLASVLGPIEGIVGFPFFARYKMTLDYQAKELTFVPNGYEPKDVLEMMKNSVMGQSAPEPRRLAPTGLWGIKVAKAENDEEAGVRITEVAKDGPAAKAGLKAGDRLLVLDDRWTDSVNDCYAAASAAPSDMEIVVLIRRDGTEKELKVKPAKGL
jgi:membrane-associated protease RseP (regulator of RpoE activity)